MRKHFLNENASEYAPSHYRSSARAYYDMQIVLFKVPRDTAIQNVIKAHLQYYGTEPTEFLKEIGYGKIQRTERN